MASTLVLLSGGVDSATALATLVRTNELISTLFFSFGQPAVEDERRAAKSISDYYGVSLKVLDIVGATFGIGEIRGRNALLVHGALLVAPRGPTTIVIGIHAGTAYPDCSDSFINLMQKSLDFHTNGEVTLAAPFLLHSKADIFNLAQACQVPLELTYSCERGGGPCGSCLSCIDRRYVNAVD